MGTTLQVSISKGKAHHAIKPGSKRKRNKAELNAVKTVESELKSDKQAFLLEVQRLKENARLWQVRDQPQRQDDDIEVLRQ